MKQRLINIEFITGKGWILKDQLRPKKCEACKSKLPKDKPFYYNEDKKVFCCEACSFKIRPSIASNETLNYKIVGVLENE